MPLLENGGHPEWTWTMSDFMYLDPLADIGMGVRIGRYCEVRAGCVIGDGTMLGSDCLLAAGTVIGKRCIIKGRFTACDTPDLDEPDEKATVIIGDDVKIGVQVVVMPGVAIGDGATIGACSQVRHDVPAGEVWYGNPARKARPKGGLPEVKCSQCGSGYVLVGGSGGVSCQEESCGFIRWPKST